MRKTLSLALILFFTLVIRAQEVVILYDNDVHCAIDGYSAMASLQQQMREESKNVLTVSAGDFLQGDVYGSMTQGADIIAIMNSIGYDVVGLGNHEFDYGIDVLNRCLSELNATAVSCNFRKNHQNCLKSYQIVNCGDMRIAFIGVVTPTTIQSSNPSCFMDEKGRTIYDFSRERLAETVQKAIDNARREKADKIILLAHLGEQPDEKGISSEWLIKRTYGIDAVIDGHSHTAVPSRQIKDRNGRNVLITQTGTRFANIGLMGISASGDITAQLIPTDSIAIRQTATAQIIEDCKYNIDQAYSVYIGHSNYPLSINDQQGNRIVRSAETNIGDLIADAIRWETQADIAFINGGSIRTDLPADITMRDLIATLPFDNQVLLATVTGQQLLDILEYSAAQLPEETGSFLQVSGITFQINTRLKSPVRYDRQGFVHDIFGHRRVSNVQILNPATGRYIPIDTKATYTIATTDYALLRRGCNGIFDSAVTDTTRSWNLVNIVDIYIYKALNGNIPPRYRNTQNRIKIL